MNRWRRWWSAAARIRSSSTWISRVRSRQSLVRSRVRFTPSRINVCVRLMESMTLSPGDKLGPYEIHSLIGKGGMGEVYRAYDSRVGRDVAIKISAEKFSERFERETRAIASL